MKQFLITRDAVNYFGFCAIKYVQCVSVCGRINSQLLCHMFDMHPISHCLYIIETFVLQIIKKKETLSIVNFTHLLSDFHSKIRVKNDAFFGFGVDFFLFATHFAIVTTNKIKNDVKPFGSIFIWFFVFIWEIFLF